MLIKKLYFVFHLIIYIQLSSLHTFAMMSPDSESDGLCGIPAKATLNPDPGTDTLYKSDIFKAQICLLENFSIEYSITPLLEDLQNWEYWHPAHWMQLFRIARALEDFSEKTDAPPNTGFQLSGYQYIDEETDIQKIKFILAPSDSPDFSTSMMTRNFNSKRVTSPIAGHFFQSRKERPNLILIRTTINQFKQALKSSHLRAKESVPIPPFCHTCNQATEEETSKLESEKPFWRLTQSESDSYYDLFHTQHICSLHHCTDVMTLELSETLPRLIRRRTTKESPENFDIHIRSYSTTIDKHLRCRITSRMLDSCDSQEKSTDSESSYDSFMEQPVETPRPRRLKEIEIPTSTASAHNKASDPAPPPPSKKGQQRLRKTISDASKYNAW